MRIPSAPGGGPALTFDFPGLAIGVAEYDDGPTGCTVFHFEPGVAVESDLRGGSIGSVNADLGFANAICFAGGSMLGLAAASGVAGALFDRRGHDHVEWTDVPVVAGAIIFDWGGRANGIYPDAALGRAALDAARRGWFPLGARGAARSATVGKAESLERAEPGGQGAAIRTSGPATILAFTVLNSLGAIHDRAGAVVHGNRGPDGTRRSITAPGAPARGNTTLTLLVTDLRIGSRQLQQAARQAHTSMARAIQPFNTDLDGDTLFFATTNRVEHQPLLAPGALGAIAAEAAWDAVLAAFP